jgi:cytoskeletal protein CcmA (bactofilin family)
MGVFKKEEQMQQHSTYSPPSTPTLDSSSGGRSVIGKTLFIKGTITSDEEIHIEGKVEGKLKVKHRVVIGKGGIVNADINGKEIVIHGRVTGNIKSSYKVEVVPGGILNGNIVSEKVVLAEGAIFKGSIDMNVGEEMPAVKKETLKEESSDTPKNDPKDQKKP